MYIHYPEKTCDGRGKFGGQSYKTISEAKDACGKDEDCEMISKICEDCGSPKEKPSYYRTCSGGFQNFTTEYALALAQFAETWVKGIFEIHINDITKFNLMTDKHK